MQRVYLDHNASTPLLPIVAEQMKEAYVERLGNASSTHYYGQQARHGLEEARNELAQCFDCPPRELIFTSGGTEADNLALQWLAGQKKPAHLITSCIEHPAVLETCRWLESQGVEVDYLPVNEEGRVYIEEISALIKSHTRLVSLMAVNNETGVIQPIEAMVDLVRSAPHGSDIRIHCDGVQAFGRIPLPWRKWGLDMLSVSAHKLGGPKGIGLLTVRFGRLPAPLAYGGSQERGLRPGTEAAPLIEGFAKAATWALQNQGRLTKHWQRCAQHLISAVDTLEGFFWNAQSAPRIANTLNIGFQGISSESLLVALDLNGVAASSGSACASGALQPSHVLQAMGLSRLRIQGSLRFSMGWNTLEEEMVRSANMLRQEVLRLQNPISHPQHNVQK